MKKNTRVLSNKEKKQRRRKRFWIIFGCVFAFLLILYIVAANILVSAALVPSFMEKLDKFEEVTEQSYAEQVQTDDIKEHRKEALTETQKWVKETPQRTLTHMTSDGYKLIANEFLREDDSHLWVLLLHGYTGWKEEMYEFAYEYYLHGYHVIVPDLRCQGASEGDFIGMGYTDSYDCMVYLEDIIAEDPEASIVIQGQSMGASTALMMGGMDDLPKQVKAIISDSGYTEGYDMFGDKMKEWAGIPPWTILDAANLMLQIRGGYDLKKASALKAVKKCPVPVLIIHGDEDKMIRPSMAEELFEAAGEDLPEEDRPEKELLIIHGAGHGQTQSKDPELFYNTIFQFIDQALS